MIAVLCGLGHEQRTGHPCRGEQRRFRPLRLRREESGNEIVEAAAEQHPETVDLVDELAGTAVERQRLGNLETEVVPARVAARRHCGSAPASADAIRQVFGGGLDEVLLLERGRHARAVSSRVSRSLSAVEHRDAVAERLVERPGLEKRASHRCGGSRRAGRGRPRGRPRRCSRPRNRSLPWMAMWKKETPARS